jgi:hypothetical protein
MAELHCIGYRFYTDRLDPRDWVYEEYLAEIEALGASRVARGLRDFYVRCSRECFAEARARRIWGMPEPPPPPPTRAIEAIKRFELFWQRKKLVSLFACRAASFVRPLAGVV